LVARSLDYINTQLQSMATEIQAQGLMDSTAIIVSAKHGQSPVDPSQLTRIPDGPIIAAVNAGWASTHPTAPPLVAQSTDDTGILWWLSDRSPAALEYAKNYLLSNPATGNEIDGTTLRTLAASGLTKVYTGHQAAHLFDVPLSDPRHPDLVGIVQQGVLYTGGKAKIADHGGGTLDDRNVPLVVYAPGVVSPDVVSRPVETTQIAPTILRLLELDPSALDAVRIEGTDVLPSGH
jgi:arylsulfatase A-like enzyme